MTTMPPRLAAWLLNRCLPGDVGDAIEGDLLEEYRHRGSRTWYWRQVAGTIAVIAVQGLRSHKGLVVRAIGMGWMSALLTSQVAARVLFGGNVRLESLQWGRDHLAASAMFTMLCACGAVSGWVVSRFHAERRVPIVMGYLAASLLLVTLALPWDSQMVSRDMFRSIMPFLLAYGFLGLPLSILFGAALRARPSTSRQDVEGTTA